MHSNIVSPKFMNLVFTKISFVIKKINDGAYCWLRSNSCVCIYVLANQV